MTPESIALSLILVSAMSHALIGAIMKQASNKLIFRGILGVTTALIMMPFMTYVPFPTSAIWVVLALSVFIHLIYHVAQALAFTHGDMSFVYPIMRGTAPALTAFFAFLVLGEGLRPGEIAGLMIVVAALIGFGWTKGTKTGDLKSALVFALLCGVLTALYTVVDAKGMRLSENRFSFIVWFFVVEGLGIALLMTVVNRAVLTKAVPIDIKKGIAAGALAVVSYGCALLAYSLAPIAHLAAVRETSVIFGALLAVFWLKEKMGTWRIGLAMVLAFGLVLMHIA